MDNTQDISGAAIEGLIAQHLKAWIDYSEQDAELFYWHTSAGNEVDFVLYGQDIFTAIEVKATKTLRPKDFNGLRAFKEDYPQCTPYMLYGGEERLVRNNIVCIPLVDFLIQLKPNQFD